MNLLFNDSPLWRGVRTSLQALGGFLIGLFWVVWNTPGVPIAVQNYLRPYEMQLLLFLGIPTVLGSGGIAYLITKWREKSKVVTQVPEENTIAETGTPVETPTL